MLATDKPRFAALLAGCLYEIYEKAVTPTLLTVWFASLQRYELADVQVAFANYITDPKDCKFPPKPGDIIRHLTASAPDDGHPSPDEAWGLLLRLIRDERETGVLTDEMRAGWQACQPILDLGDEIGARRCFLETYARWVAEARQRGFKARFTATLGTDPKLREQRLLEAVNARRMDSEQVRLLLPGPAPASLDQVAGLLEGPTAPKSDVETAARLRALAAMIRSSSAAAEQQRNEERARARAAEAEQKRWIGAMLDDGKEAACG